MLGYMLAKKKKNTKQSIDNTTLIEAVIIKPRTFFMDTTQLSLPLSLQCRHKGPFTFLPTNQI